MARLAANGNTRRRRLAAAGAVVFATLLLPQEPPTEFRIFAAGENIIHDAPFLFDAKAAASVMAAFEKHGADIMLDLEHLSAEDPATSVGYDPDARGWCKLEVRNGELWATQVRWTPDGEARLKEGRQRYISPVALYEKGSLRILKIVNIALCAMPATDNLDPLVAASLAYEGASSMTPDQFAALAEALGLGADANVEDVLAQVAAMVKKIQDAANGTAPADDTAAMAADAPAANDAPPVAASKRLSTAARKLARLAGKTEIGEVVSEVETWRASHLKVEAETTRLAQERATLEGAERRKLVGELVVLGSETPATAWADDTATTPAKRLVDEPIAELRGRVAKIRASKGTTRREVAPPTGDVNGLTPEQLKICADTGCKPEVFASLRKSNPALAVRS